MQLWSLRDFILFFYYVLLFYYYFAIQIVKAKEFVMRSENTAGNRGKKDGYFGFSCLFSHELVIFVTLCLFVIYCVSTKSTTALYFVLYYFSEIFLNLFF